MRVGQSISGNSLLRRITLAMSLSAGMAQTNSFIICYSISLCVTSNLEEQQSEEG